MVAESHDLRLQYSERAPMLLDEFVPATEGAEVWEESPAIVGIEGQTFINGFLSDTFVDLDAGVGLIEAQVERLLGETSEPADVLFFIDYALGDDVYRPALDSLESRGAITVTQSFSHASFAMAIASGDWDLVVSASQTGCSSD